MRPRAIELHVDALVLRGFDRVRRAEVERALGEELERLLSESANRWEPRGDEGRRIERGELRLASPVAGESFGRSLARVLHGTVVERVDAGSSSGHRLADGVVDRSGRAPGAIARAER